MSRSNSRSSVRKSNDGLKNRNEESEKTSRFHSPNFGNLHEPSLDILFEDSVEGKENLVHFNRADVCSKIDDSCLADPFSFFHSNSHSQSQSNLPVDSSVNGLLKTQAQNYNKALIVLQANYNSYKEQTERYIQTLRSELSALKDEKYIYYNHARNEIMQSIRQEFKIFEEDFKGKPTAKGKCKARHNYQKMIKENQALKGKLEALLRDDRKRHNVLR